MQRMLRRQASEWGETSQDILNESAPEAGFPSSSQTSTEGRACLTQRPIAGNLEAPGAARGSIFSLGVCAVDPALTRMPEDQGLRNKLQVPDGHRTSLDSPGLQPDSRFPHLCMSPARNTLHGPACPQPRLRRPLQAFSLASCPRSPPHPSSWTGCPLASVPTGVIS